MTLQIKHTWTATSKRIAAGRTISIPPHTQLQKTYIPQMGESTKCLPLSRSWVFASCDVVFACGLSFFLEWFRLFRSAFWLLLAGAWCPLSISRSLVSALFCSFFVFWRVFFWICFMPLKPFLSLSLFVFYLWLPWVVYVLISFLTGREGCQPVHLWGVFVSGFTLPTV